MPQSWTWSLGLALAICGIVRPAAAPSMHERVHFVSGDAIHIEGHRSDGDAVVLVLHGGVEIRCDSAMIDRIEPDRHRTARRALSNAAVTVRSSGIPARQSRPYHDLVQNASQAHNVHPRLIHAVIKAESNYDAKATSHRGAAGLMQLMPALAADYSVDDLYNPQTNIDTGARHLRYLIQRYGIDVGLAAYNAGEGSVQRFGGIPPYPETRRYVAGVLDSIDTDAGE